MSSGVESREHRAGVLGSVAVHLVLIAALVALQFRPTPPTPVIYAVNLIAAPAPRPAPRRAAQEATPTARQPEVAEEQQAEPEKAPEPPAKPAEIKRDDKALPTRSETEPLPGEAPSTGSDQLTFIQAGIRFQDQAYLENIVTQIRRRWTNPFGSGIRLRVDVTFTIQRDGTVTDIEVARPSANFSFNASARGAIERAARDHAFGPLPDSYNGKSLPISFAFTPEEN